MKRKILSVLIIIMAILTFSGCAKVTFSVVTNKDGNIIETVYVQPDYEKFSAAGYSRYTVNERIVSIYKSYIKEQEALFNEYNLTEYQKTYVLNHIDNRFSIDDGVIILSRIYDSYSDYIYFNRLLDSVGIDTSQTEESFLYTLKSSTTKTIFSQLNEENSLVKYIEEMFSIEFDCPFELKDVNFAYEYGDTDKKQHSNADTKYQEDGIYYHQWEISSSNLSREITFYKYEKINTLNWYYIALYLTAIFLIIMLSIGKIISISRKIKKKNN